VPLRDTGEGYTAWAGTYDVRANPIVHLEGPFTAALFARIEPGRALDAACGTGRHAAVLAELGHEVVGVDASPAMLERARERIPGADFRIGELEALPLDAGAVDLAVCSLALTHLEAPEPAVAELARVVRPGGRIVLSDVHPTWVALGAQAAFRDVDDRRGYIHNHVHWTGDYLRAFRASGLDVLACHELPYGREQADLWVDQLEIDREVVLEAVVGMPAVLVWEIART
jgi:ubiquinone/menaquinone biosynthesis C-methylase UbiE